MKKKKIIIDLCGGTAAWSEWYRHAGYLVHNITLPMYDVRLTMVMGNTLQFRSADPNDAGVLVVPMADIHGILAAPPCTEFSLAKNSQPRNFLEGMSVVRSCLDVIWAVRIYGNLKWWALENPRGFLRQFLGKPAYHFEAWWFGDNMKKPTDLWGYFNEPTKKRGAVRPDYPRKGKGSWANRARGGDPKRSITPAGFAKAFFKANP